jgi:hypothetical protein
MVNPETCIKPPTSTSVSNTETHTKIDIIRFPIRRRLMTHTQRMAMARFLYNSSCARRQQILNARANVYDMHLKGIAARAVHRYDMYLYHSILLEENEGI